ncbi:MAG: M60 family metallopeptidase, partial [Culturomica sp.]|nr:M60 family metallopeptidase [Culturomica sp.]
MRRLLWIVALFTLAWACKDDDKTIGPGPGDFYLDLSKESVLAWDTLTYVKIDVSTNGEFWDVQADSTAPWCEPSMNDTKTDRSITLRIAPNGNAGERQAEIKVNGEDDIVKIITVKQMGTAPTIIYHAGDLDKISDDSVRLIIDIEANMEYDIIIPEAYQSWLSWAGTEEGDRVRNYFTVNRNLGEPRDGMIILKGIQYPEIEEEIYLRQLAYNSEYTPVDPGDIGKSKDIKLKMVSATASSYQGGAEASKLIDGGLGTGWHSNWGGANTDLPITLELTLEENQNTLDYIMYYPRSPRGNGTPGLVDIDYTTADDPTNYKVFGKYDFGMLADTRKLTPPAPITAPAKIRLIVRSGVGGFGSINEVEAWQIAQPDPTILGIFTDNTYSALNPGVTYEMITQLPEPFLFNIAKYLLTGDYPVADRVREYLPYRHPDNVAKELKTSTYSLYDNPTGIYFRPMDDVVVFVGATNGEQVGIRIINPMNGGLQEETFSLQEGENKFTSRYGGLAYINYYTENSKAQPLKVHVASGFVNGLFDVTKHTKADWGGILDNATYAALDVVGERMHLLFEVEDWKTVSDPVELIRAWDDIVKLEEELMGLVKYDRVPKNRVFGHVDKSPTASWMYATAYRTGYS